MVRGRPRKYESPEERQEARRLSKRKYNNGLVAKTKRLRKLKHLRGDQIRIVEDLRYCKWDVSHTSRTRFYAANRLDNLKNWAIGTLVKSWERYFVIDESFKMAFRNDNDIHAQPWVLDCFSRYRKTPLDLIDKHLTTIDERIFISVGCGYLCSTIINRFIDIYQSLTADNNTTANAVDITNKLLRRLGELVCVIDAVKEVFNKCQTMEDQDLAKRLLKLNMAIGWFSLQEAAMIRFDLWIRYGHSLQDILGYYQQNHLAWQISWPNEFKRYVLRHSSEQDVASPLQFPYVDPHEQLDNVIGPVTVFYE